MRIKSYLCRDANEDGWRFSPVNFRQVNLLVGGTGSGKSRLLNTIFNLGSIVGAKARKQGYWDVTFEHESHTYRWEIDVIPDEGKSFVRREKLSEITADGETILVDRDQSQFVFNGNALPKLQKDEPSVSLLRNEDSIKPIFQAFSTIQRRNFDLGALEAAGLLQPIPLELVRQLQRETDLREVWRAELSLSAVLYLLAEFFKPIFLAISTHYKSLFPFIVDVSIKDFSELNRRVTFPGKVPVLCVRERDVSTWITIENLSSGMKKVLLILTDLYLLPEGGIYLIDEYENSLGVNAVEFLPSFILSLEKNLQYFITSHHPYLINRIPIQDWYVFHRHGSKVQIKYGNELAERFSKSKQQAFIQLINDPFYVHGVQ